MSTLDIATKLVTDFGAMGILAYCIIRVLRMAERITDVIVTAFQKQTDNIEALTEKIDALEGTMNSHVKALATRINEAQLALTSSGHVGRVSSER